MCRSIAKKIFCAYFSLENVSIGKSGTCNVCSARNFLHFLDFCAQPILFSCSSQQDNLAAYMECQRKTCRVCCAYRKISCRAGMQRAAYPTVLLLFPPRFTIPSQPCSRVGYAVHTEKLFLERGQRWNRSSLDLKRNKEHYGFFAGFFGLCLAW